VIFGKSALDSLGFLKDSMVGCIYVISWDGDRSRIRFGYSTNMKSSLEALSEANWHRLLVRKVIPAPSGMAILDELVGPFEELRLRGYWFRLDTSLRNMLQGLSDAATHELEGELISASIAFVVISCTNEMSPYRTRQLANGIKQCRHYILWMFNECEKASVKVVPKLLIEHQANNGRFKEKTIYNELSAMRNRGLLATVKPYGETLTLFGRKELERLNLVVGL